MSDAGWIVIGLLWLVFWVAEGGFTYAYYQRHWPRIADVCRVEDSCFAIAFGFLGPIASLTAITHGLVDYRDPLIMYRYGWLVPGAKP